jgi:hypothetical protein
VLDQHCAAVGRDPSTITRSVQVRPNLVDPERARETIRGYIEAGATHLVLILQPPYPEGIAHRLAETIIEPLLAEFRHT